MLASQAFLDPSRIQVQTGQRGLEKGYQNQAEQRARVASWPPWQCLQDREATPH